MLVVLWQRSPALSIALVGPLLAIALYQRSTFRAMRAMRLALTDPLTGLGNHRSFHERLQRELAAAEHDGNLGRALPLRPRRPQVDQRPLRPSDRRPRAQPGRGATAPGRRGVPARRRRVRRPPAGTRRAPGVRGRALDRRAGRGDARSSGVGAVTVSAGVATYPTHGAGRDELIRLADSALYWAKEDGKNRARAYAAESILRAPASSSPTAPTAPRATARPRASHRRSTRATRTPAAIRSGSASYAARIARRLGAEEPPVELTRLGRQPARPRQARDPRGDPPQAGRRSARPSGSCSSAIRRSATGCSRASASSRSPSGCSTTTSAGTAPATRAGSPASRSRSARESSSLPTPTTR